jgi:hypothetical protein
MPPLPQILSVQILCIIYAHYNLREKILSRLVKTQSFR